MPHQQYTTIMKGVKKYVLKNTQTGKTYYFGSEKKRETGKRMHEIFKHMKKGK